MVAIWNLSSAWIREITCLVVLVAPSAARVAVQCCILKCLLAQMFRHDAEVGVKCMLKRGWRRATRQVARDTRKLPLPVAFVPAG